LPWQLKAKPGKKGEVPELNGRVLLFALPALSVGVVAFALFGAGAERTVRAARVYGGPTATAPLSFRLELVDSFKGVLTPASGPVRVVIRAPDGSEARWSGEAGSDGVVEATLPALAPHPRLELSVLQSDRLLAAGPIALGAKDWLAGAVRRGGWQTFELGDELRLELAPARGVFAVPFPSELLLRVTRAGAPVDAELELAAQGALVSGGRLKSGVEPARASLTPREHTPSLRVRVLMAGAAPREITTVLPVVPGAFDARLEGEALVVTSAVPRERAYFTLINEQRRVAGGSITLADDGRGSVRLAALPAGPLWAVVGSSPELSSPARVGHPIAGQVEPARTLDVSEALLLDGLPLALSRESGRRKRARFVAAAVCALSLLLGTALLAARARRASLALSRHFAERGLDAGAQRALVPSRPLWLAIALGAVALGFAVLALFALLVEH
jgi:hypothetical protein